MKQNTQPKYQYFDMVLQQQYNLLSFSSLQDLQRYIQLHNIKTIYRLLPQERSGTETNHHFALMHNGALMQQDAMGFETLEDHSRAVAAGFPDAATFYKASADGYTRFKDYELVLQCGIADKEVFDKISKAGFIDGFTQYQELIAGQDPMVAEIGTFTNPRELYEAAIARGFSDYNGFTVALKKRFTEALEEKVALDKGFTNGDDYRTALARGFTNASDYQMALTNGCRDYAEAQRLGDLGTMEPIACLHDEKLLLNILSRLQPGKRISINKLENLLQESLDSYRYADDGTMPPWFKTALNDQKLIQRFLTGNDAVKKFGSYDTEGEYFEISPLRERSIVIDGSNVAFNSGVDNHEAGRKAELKNIEKLAVYLKEKGFNEIIVIADASLRHHVKDLSNLPSVKAVTTYMEAPAGRPADVFLISYVKQHRCMVVTNDNFREWKIADPWVALYMDYYRLSFLIKDENILMPDLNN